MKNYCFIFSSLAISLCLHGEITTAQTSTDCSAPTAKMDLDINNVRVKLMSGGSMWWDFNDPGYEVPKGSGKHSLFAGSIWLGGLDATNNLHLAAQTYRQTGVDFWAGPLDTNAQTKYDVCVQYDRIFKINRVEVEEFILKFGQPGYEIPSSILNWPGNGNTAEGYAKYLAPFKDVNADGIYNPYAGDYPEFNTGTNCKGKLQGDQSLWWVFNDRGNIHTESQGNSFGFEIHAQAFAFQTTDELNDMTFYEYKIINRSSTTYNNMHWGHWADGDIGNYDDDYIGCDVGRGLGYYYNGKAMDGTGGGNSYGAKPPAVGIDFLEGPLADTNDGIDNDRDGIIDETGETISMTKFVYHNNDGSDIGNPGSASDYYNYLKGIWRDGTPMTYGGNGHLSSSTLANFMFPGDTDPTGTTWTEITAGNLPADRRSIVSAGPFTMQPGAIRTITLGIPWAQDSTNIASLEKLKLADDKAQQLFDNCLQLPCYSPLQIYSYEVKDRTVDFKYNYIHINSISWNFGDGGTSTERFPSHTYAVDGTYNVCVTVSNECDTVSFCEAVTVDYKEDELGVKLTRIEGQGNGGLVLEFTKATIDEILLNNRSLHPTYKHKRGPVDVTVIDPVALPTEAQFTIQFTGVDSISGWKCFIQGDTDTVYSSTTIKVGTEQVIPEWGISIEAKQSRVPGNSLELKNGFITASKSFSDTSKKWLSGIADMDADPRLDWIRSGENTTDYSGIDNGEYYENILGRTWAPYRLGGINYGGPAWQASNVNKMENLASVNLIITSDKAKWTRSPVIELQEDSMLAVGKAKKMSLRKSPSVNKDGLSDGTGSGMGWFPGYAINLETGERLNIVFGEDSYLTSENGADMLWNPTSNTKNTNGDVVMAGRHYIYIMGHNGDALYPATDPYLANTLKDVPRYDEGKMIHDGLTVFNLTNTVGYKRNIYKDAMWVGLPLLDSGHNLLSSDVTIKLRVAKPYSSYNTSASPLNNNFPMYNFDASDISVSVKADALKNRSFAYPNPFSEKTIIIFSRKNNEPVNLNVFDMTGKLVKNLQNVKGDYIILERGDLKNGLYLYQLEDKNGNSLHTGKLVVH